MADTFWTPSTPVLAAADYAKGYVATRVAGPASDGSQDSFAQTFLVDFASISTLAAPGGSTGLGFILSANAQNENVSTVLKRIVFVTSYDAFAHTGTTNAAIAIQKAHDDLPSAGGTIVFPAGTDYRMDNGVVFTKPVHLDFQGGLDGGSRIIVNFTTGDLFYAANTLAFTATDCSVWCFSYRTSGAFFNLVQCQNVIFDRFRFVGGYRGIELDGCTISRLRNGRLENFTPDAIATGSCLIAVGRNHATVDAQISGVTADAPASGQPTAGIVLMYSDAAIIGDCDIIHNGTDLLLAPANGQTCSASFVHDSYFDTAVHGIVLSPAAGGQCVRNWFSGTWTGSHTQQGVVLQGAGTILGTHFNDHRCMFCASDGIANLNGTDLHIDGGIYAGNSGSGYTCSVGQQRFWIKGAKIGSYDGAGPNGIGIFIPTGCTNYEITECDLTGNTTTAISDASNAGVVRNCTGFITRNRGTSAVASGQTAIVVNHGLPVAPGSKDISVTPLAALGTNNLWVDPSTITTTSFTVKTGNGTAASSLSFAWSASALGA